MNSMFDRLMAAVARVGYGSPSSWPCRPDRMAAFAEAQAVSAEPTEGRKMSPEIRDAIEAARQPRKLSSVADANSSPRRWSFDHVHYTVLAVLRDVPDGMTVAELRDELEIANNQGRRT